MAICSCMEFTLEKRGRSFYIFQRENVFLTYLRRGSFFRDESTGSLFAQTPLSER